MKKIAKTLIAVGTAAAVGTGAFGEEEITNRDMVVDNNQPVYEEIVEEQPDKPDPEKPEDVTPEEPQDIIPVEVSVKDPKVETPEEPKVEEPKDIIPEEVSVDRKSVV